MSTLTCHTDGCPHNGVPVEMDMTWQMEMEGGETVTVTSTTAYCGPCGQQITDIVPPPEGSA